MFEMGRGPLAFLLPALFAIIVSSEVGAPSQQVTFNKDVAPILYSRCVVCHRPNDIAPMSLLTYHDARPWAAAIRQAVVKRTMPPWHADPQVGTYLNDRRLSDSEIATIEAWVKGGAKEGTLQDLPKAPEFTSGWHIKPDLVLSVPEQTVAASTQDDYEYIYVPTNFSEDRWVQAAEVMPGDRRVVHHATVSVIAADKVPTTKKPGEDPGPFEFRTGQVNHLKPDAPVSDDGCATSTTPRLSSFSGGYVNIVPGIYLPGHLAETRPPGYALRIPAGSYLQFQIHYSNRLSETVKDRTSIGLVFSREPVTREVAQYEIWNNYFLIPPGDGEHKVTSCFTLPKDVTAIAYTAHMHFRGKSMSTEAVYPDGHHELIFRVPSYDFRWQETYFLKNQFVLPKGTKLVTTAYFDNSPNNPLNPDPSKAIRWGEPSNEEMMGFWLAFADVLTNSSKPSTPAPAGER